jgi:uncharacterized membrane protein YbjE (DUF340 family)
MPWLIGAVVAGVLCGAWGWLPEAAALRLDKVIWAILLLMLFGIGLELGQNPQAGESLRAFGAKALLFPLVVGLASLLGTIPVGWVLGLRWNEAGAIGVGCGYYSLTGVLVTELHSAQLGTVAFLANLGRELLALLLIPFLARHVTPFAAVAVGGATAMDTTLPLIDRSTEGQMTALAVVQGLVLTGAVPLGVPLLLRW